jgi:hypothetical protein
VVCIASAVIASASQRVTIPMYGLPTSGPIAQLFDIGRIALFLDGLEEMPDMLRSKAVERLAGEAAGRRLVITSRPDEFRETIDLGRHQLPYTAVIELAPVRPRAAAEYLLEGQIGAARQTWTRRRAPSRRSGRRSG